MNTNVVSCSVLRAYLFTFGDLSAISAADHRALGGRSFLTAALRKAQIVESTLHFGDQDGRPPTVRARDNGRAFVRPRCEFEIAVTISPYFTGRFGTKPSTFSLLTMNICPDARLRIGYFPSINELLTASEIGFALS